MTGTPARPVLYIRVDPSHGAEIEYHVFDTRTVKPVPIGWVQRPVVRVASWIAWDEQGANRGGFRTRADAVDWLFDRAQR